jgi:hypothetical protein
LEERSRLVQTDGKTDKKQDTSTSLDTQLNT